MSKKVEFKLNEKGLRELMKSDKMEDIVEEYAQTVKTVAEIKAGKQGEGYEYDTYKGKTRVNAMVWTDTPEAKKDNLENNTLLKSLDTKIY